MPDNIYLDNAARKRIVTFWIPVCLGFLHLWATAMVLSMILPTIKVWGMEPLPQAHVEVIYKAFKTCNWAIWGLILLLISDKALELIISRAGNVAAAAAGQIVEKTTEKIVTTTSTPPPAKVENATIEAENVNIT